MIDQLRTRLETLGQSHLLAHWDDLDEARRARFLSELESVPWTEVKRCIDGEEASIDWSAVAARALPPPAIRLKDPTPKWSLEGAREVGERVIRQSRMGVILVAGGQGTRLGFDLPKGMFPIGPLSQRTLFAMHVDRLRAVMKKYSVSIPLFIMTSPATDAQTRAYFAEHDRLGLREDELIILCQGTMPAVDAATGKVLLEAKDALALSPDGHGGLIAALRDQQCLAMAKQRGIDYFFYGQVDNPLVGICDPVLIGYHDLAQSEMTTQVVPKRFAKEKVGNVVELDGHVAIIEYSDLPDAVAEQTQPDGSLRLWAGNIAVHLLNRSFLEQVAQSDTGLPFHRANKAVPYLDGAGLLIQPAKPNAIKFERFIFDLLPLAKNAIVVEGDAREVFAPVKNADGAAVDTPTSCREAICQLHTSWLRNAGATIDPGIRVEIDPLWAMDGEEVRSKVTAGLHIAVDSFFCA